MPAHLNACYTACLCSTLSLTSTLDQLCHHGHNGVETVTSCGQRSEVHLRWSRVDLVRHASFFSCRPRSIHRRVAGIQYLACVELNRTLRLAEKAFGSHPDSLGIIVVRDLPQEYMIYRERLLKLAYLFARLDVAVQESYTDPRSRYR